VLSNYHVLEADIVSGGNAALRRPAMRSCSRPDRRRLQREHAQNVASLSGIKSLPGSNVDCAIARRSRPGAHGRSILEVGTISASTVGASVGQA